MVSSLRHVLRGQSDPYTVAVAVAFTVWWLSLYSRRPSFFVWVLIGVFPLLVLPDFTLPLDIAGAVCSDAKWRERDVERQRGETERWREMERQGRWRHRERERWREVERQERWRESCV
jgi:hypothetical protein